jgi:hypothetical protein
MPLRQVNRSGIRNLWDLLKKWSDNAANLQACSADLLEWA